MNVLWLVVALIVVTWGLSIVELCRGKRPRKIILKEQVNWNAIFFGLIAMLLVVMSMFAGETALAQVILHKDYVGLDWASIAFVHIALWVLLWFGFFSVMIFLLWVVRTPGGGNFGKLWKFTPEELEFKKVERERTKTKVKGRVPAWLFKGLYPEERVKKVPTSKFGKWLDSFIMGPRKVK